MFNRVMKADVGFKTTDDRGLSVKVEGYKPLIQAGMYQLIMQLVSNTGNTVEEFCHEMIGLDKSVSLEMAGKEPKDGDRFNIAFNQIMEAEAKDSISGLDRMFDAIFGADGEDHIHDCDNCGAYNMCDLPHKKARSANKQEE